VNALPADAPQAKKELDESVRALGEVEAAYKALAKDPAKPAPPPPMPAPLEDPFATCATSLKDPRCSHTLVFREPVPAKLTLVTANADFNLDGDDLGADVKIGQLAFPMAQYGAYAYLPLTVSFAGSKNVTIGLDEFGRKTSLALVGVSDAAAALNKTLDGESLLEKKARVEALDTQLKLNKLERCQEIIRAGGFVCPEK
jgi:hypothetical protein